MTTPDLAEAQIAAAAPIPALLTAVRDDPEDVERVKAFWRAYLALPLWLFIARGTSEAPAPFIAVLDERPTLLVFSSAQGAQAAGIAAGLPPEEAAMLLAIPASNAVDWVAAAAGHGVLDLQVDRHLGGFIVPITAPPQIRASLAQEDGATPSGGAGVDG